MSDTPSGCVFIRGEIVPSELARISVLDHSVLYGDGVFETFRVVDGHIFRMPDHLRRLVRSSRAISLNLPMPLEDISRALIRTVAASGLANCFVKLVVTRGAGELPVLNHAGLTSELIIIATPAIPLVAGGDAGGRGISAAIVGTRKTAPAAFDPRVKSLNYLNIIKSRIEAHGLGADESILLDDRGRVVEASVYNLIAVRGNKLTTPLEGCLEGITLDTVIGAAQGLGLCIDRSELYPYDIAVADEIILTSTATGVIPVVTLNGQPVGAGVPGPIWAKLADAYGASLKDPTYLTSTNVG